MFVEIVHPTNLQKSAKIHHQPLKSEKNLLIGASWLLNLATASDLVLTQFSSSSEKGDPLPSPVKLSFKLSESTVLPDTTNSKLPEGHAVEYVESMMTVDTDGLNLLELKLKDGRKVTFEFRVER